MHKTLPNWSLSVETFKRHCIHSIATIHALTTAMRMPVTHLSGIIIAFSSYFNRQPCRLFVRGVPVGLHSIPCYKPFPNSSPISVTQLHTASAHAVRTLDYPFICLTDCLYAWLAAQLTALTLAHLAIYLIPHLDHFRHFLHATCDLPSFRKDLSIFLCISSHFSCPSLIL